MSSHPPGALVTPAPSTQVHPGCSLPAPPTNSPQLPGQSGRSAPGDFVDRRGAVCVAVGTGSPCPPPQACPPPRAQGVLRSQALGCVGLACTQAAWEPTLSGPCSPSADELPKVTPGVLQFMGPNCGSAHGPAAVSLSLEGHFQSHAVMGPDGDLGEEGRGVTRGLGLQGLDSAGRHI